MDNRRRRILGPKTTLDMDNWAATVYVHGMHAKMRGDACEVHEPRCSQWADQHPADPWNPALLAGAVLHSGPLVAHCHSRDGNETLYSTFCQGGPYLAAQRYWLTWLDHERSSLRRNASDRDELSTYVGTVYPNAALDVSTTVINASRMEFFWNTVPGRTSFRVLWSCASCSTKGYRAPSALWTPSEEATSNPFLFERGYLRHCNVTEHPSCASPLVRNHVLQTVEVNDREAVHIPGFMIQKLPQRPFHFPGFFRAAAVPGGKNSTQLVSATIPDGTWCEVMRVARWNIDSNRYPTESTRGQVWFWLAVGSGIWWNVGRSLRLSHEKNNKQSAAEPSNHSFSRLLRSIITPDTRAPAQCKPTMGARAHASKDTTRFSCPTATVDTSTSSLTAEAKISPAQTTCGSSLAHPRTSSCAWACLRHTHVTHPTCPTAPCRASSRAAAVATIA